MQIVTKYKCDHCGELLNGEEECIKHEDKHTRVNKANEMLKDGCTLQEINNETHIWREVPEYLKEITKDNCFRISYWQCCEKPAYQITYIHFSNYDCCVEVRGCGSWDGYYGNKLLLDSTNLKNPRPKEELFVDKRYAELYKI